MEDLLIIQKIEDMMRYGYQAIKANPMKRHEYLIISAVCLVGFILTLASIARAETTVGFEVIGSGAGYDTGYGVAVSHTTGRYADIFAAHVSGNIANRKKHNASEGYTYGASGSRTRFLHLELVMNFNYVKNLNKAIKWIKNSKTS